jgi:hypothetical protein
MALKQQAQAQAQAPALASASACACVSASSSSNHSRSVGSFYISPKQLAAVTEMSAIHPCLFEEM